MKRRMGFVLTSIVILVCLLGIWQALVSGLHVPSFMLPGPVSVARAGWTRIASLAHSFFLSAQAAFIGLAVSIPCGVTASLIFAQWSGLRKLLLPYTILLQTVPILAVAPLIIMWVGTGLSAIALVTFIICLPPIIVNTTQGLVSVERNLIDLFLMHKATRAQILFKLRLPHALPNLFTGVRISAGVSVIGAISGELFAGSNRVGEGGLGYAILYANSQLETDYLFALVAAAAVLGFLFFFVTMFLEWWFLHNWHESSRSDMPE
jgi:NitT/TauT family transport system permease protein